MVRDDFVGLLLPKLEDIILINEPQLSNYEGHAFSMIPIYGRNHVIYGKINWAFELFFLYLESVSLDRLFPGNNLSVLSDGIIVRNLKLLVGFEVDWFMF